MKVTITYDIDKCDNCPYKRPSPEGPYCGLNIDLYLYPEGRTTIIDNCPIKEQLNERRSELIPARAKAQRARRRNRKA